MTRIMGACVIIIMACVIVAQVSVIARMLWR